MAQRLRDLGYELLATPGTAGNLRQAGVRVEIVQKLQEGHPNLLDYLANEDVQLIMNTPSGKGARTDEGKIRAACVSRGVPCVTTIQGIGAVVSAMEAVRAQELERGTSSRSSTNPRNTRKSKNRHHLSDGLEVTINHID